jgi:ribosomal protein L37AE/L43A
MSLEHIYTDMAQSDDTDKQGFSENRAEDECPQCGRQGAQNPVLDDWYECNNCVIAFNADGEVDNAE